MKINIFALIVLLGPAIVGLVVGILFIGKRVEADYYTISLPFKMSLLSFCCSYLGWFARYINEKDSK